MKKWVELVPDNFIFCQKMSRYLTHMKKLKNPEEPLERFFSVFEYMKGKMGPVLIQLPEMLRFNYDVVDYFYRLLRLGYSAYRFVMEIRHDSWLQEDSLTLLTKYNIGFVISQSGGFFPYAEIVMANNVYVRLHGPAELYASAYTNEQLRSFAEKCKARAGEGHTIWAYFNNDIHAHAVRDAQRLMQLLG